MPLSHFRMEIPFVFTLLQSGVVHGLAFWFDVAYAGSKYEACKFTFTTSKSGFNLNSIFTMIKCLESRLVCAYGHPLSSEFLFYFSIYCGHLICLVYVVVWR